MYLCYRLILVSFAALSFLAALVPPAPCADNNALLDNEKAPSQSLKGGVDFNALEVQNRLAEMDGYAEAIRGDCKVLAHLLTRKQAAHAVSPNVIGGTALMVIPPVPQPSGYIATGRKVPVPQKQFHKLLAELRKHVSHARKDMLAIGDLPPSLEQEIGTQWQEVATNMQTIVKSCNHLINSWSRGKRSDLDLGKDIITIHDDSKKVHEALNQIVTIVQNYTQENGSLATTK